MGVVLAGMEIPLWSPMVTSPALGSAFALNGATDQLEFIAQIHEPMTITRVGFRQATVTGTAPTYKASIQGVDGSGLPDGTILGGGSPASTTFTPVSGGNNTWQWKTLDNSIAVSRGDWIAIVISHDSGTIDGSNNCSFTPTGAHLPTPGIPYCITNDAGSRSRQASAAIFGYGTSTTPYGNPLQSVIATAFNSSSNPNEKGNAFVIPVDFCASYKVGSAPIHGTMAAGTSYDVILYDSDGSTVLQSITIDTDKDASATSARRREIHFDESSLATLTAGTKYFLMLKPATTTGIVLAGMTVAAAADMDAYVGGSAMCHSAVQTSGGGITEDTTIRYGINPVIFDITPPVGGGGISAARQFGGM